VIIGRVRFGTAYEGPPGFVHGGFVAAAFDDVLGLAQSLSNRAGMTGTLTVRYRRPTPLHTDLVFEGRLVSVDGRKILTEGVSRGPDGEVTAEAEGLFVTVDFERMAELKRARLAREEQERGA
jgi:acyl-coenzyme A thioesterase PaaI-like protein